MRFASAENQVEHEMIHTGEKPFRSQHWLKGFTEQSATLFHERTCPLLDVLKSEAADKSKKKSGGLGGAGNSSSSLSRHEAVLHSRVKKPQSRTEHSTLVQNVKLPFLPELLKCTGLEA